MHFPKYWTAARHKNLTAGGWSDQNLGEAASRAAERLLRIRDWLARRGGATLPQSHGYSDARPMREEVLRGFLGPDV